MKVKGLDDECFTDYKEISMYIAMPTCSFKCDHENGNQYCQNWSLTREPDIRITLTEIIERYDTNPLTKAIIFGGLEPFDSDVDLQAFIMKFRQAHEDPIVIYTGYTEDEVKSHFDWIYLYENIVIKYGRYRPNQAPHYDEILGVNLASDNQYAKRYNWLEGY